MNESYVNYSNENTLNAINSILPEIEDELRNQINQELDVYYEQKQKQQIINLQIKAEQEYQQAIQILNNEAIILQKQKISELESQIHQIQIQYEQKNKEHLKNLQEKFIRKYFEQKVMQHPKIIDIEAQIAQQLLLQYQNKHEINKQRKIRELVIKLENRQSHDRKGRDKALKAQVFGSNGMQQLAREISMLKIGIGSMKSQYNIKIHKIQAQIKTYRDKCKSIIANREDLLTLRSTKQQLLQKKVINQRQKCLNKACHISQQNISQSKIYNFMTNDHVDDVQYINDDIVLQSNESSQNSNSYEMNKPVQRLTLYKDELPHNQQYSSFIEPPSIHLESSFHQEIDNTPLLDINVAQTLRQKWEKDPFYNYISSENDMNKSNQSNFSQLYEWHLKKLRQAPSKNISNKAKKSIIKQLACQHNKFDFKI